MDIVFLNELWIGAIPSKLGRIKATMIEKLEETGFDCRKSLVLGKVFTEVVFSLKPNVFNRILIGRIGGKREADQLPIFFVETPIDLG